MLYRDGDKDSLLLGHSPLGDNIIYTISLSSVVRVGVTVEELVA